MDGEVMPPWASLLTYMGLAGLVVLSIMRGWLVPKGSVDKLVETLEKRLADRDRIIEVLTAANAALDERNDLLADQVRNLVASGYASGPSASFVAPQEVRSPAGVPGSPTPQGQASAPPRRTQAGGYAKASRRGKRSR